MFSIINWVSKGRKIFCENTSRFDESEKKAYSYALLNCGTKPKRISACPLAFGEVGLKTRIKGVMSYKKPTLWIIILALIASLVLAVCFLTDPINEKSNESIRGNTYSILSTEYASKDYEADALTGFVISEKNELGLICNIKPEFYLTLSITMTRPFDDSRLNVFKPTKENFDVLFDGRYFIAGLSEEKLRKENKDAWITKGARGEGIADTYILLSQENGDMYIVASSDGEANFVFALAKSASLFDTSDISYAEINNNVQNKATNGSAIISWCEYYVGSEDCASEFMKYALDSKYLAYGSIRPLPALEINSLGELQAFLERHEGKLDLESTEYYKYTDGKTAPFGLAVKMWDENFFSHSKLVFVCISSLDGYRYQIESLGISDEEFRANVAEIGYYGESDKRANWIIAIEMSKTIPAASKERYEAITVSGADKFVYESVDGYLTLKPYFILDGESFGLSFSSYSSYYMTGSVKREENEIILQGEDGSRYVFEKSGDNYIFIAQKSSEVPSLKWDENASPEPCFPDGAVFVFQKKLIFPSLPD